MSDVITPQSKYSWMLNMILQLPAGQTHIAHKGVQYDCESESFGGVVYQVARQRGLAATIVTTDKAVAYNFFKPTDYLKPNLRALPVVQKMLSEA